MNDLVDDLRSLADCDARSGEPLGKLMRIAADALEAKDAEIARLQRVVDAYKAEPQLYTRADIAAMADRIEALERENERLRRFIEVAHDACADPTRPRQSIGEILAAALAFNTGGDKS